MFSTLPVGIEVGYALQRQGNLAEAERIYVSILQRHPQNIAALQALGVLVTQLGQFVRATSLLRYAVALQPHNAALYVHCGDALRAAKLFHDAMICYDRAISLSVNNFVAHLNRGITEFELMRPADALRCYDRAIQLKPDLFEAYSNSAIALSALQRPGEALARIDKALVLRPDQSSLHCNRATALLILGRTEEAMIAYQKAIDRWPDNAEAHKSYGDALISVKRFNEARDNYIKAVTVKPHYAEAHISLGKMCLLLEEYDEGWRLCEWRHSGRIFPKPPWNGKDNIEGKTLYIHAEQAIGDVIQFSRYAQVAQARGANVIFAVQPHLMRLMDGLRPAVEIGDYTDAYPTFDFHIPLLSMPWALRTGPRNFPDQVPYLRAEPAYIAKWKARIGSEGFKVGICWQGSTLDISRSFPLHFLVPLAGIPGVRLINLQKIAGTEQLLNLPAGTVESLGEDWEAGPDTMIDTAAVMENLDLIISPDTAIAHLAGALGRPAWIALKYVPDWRWLLDRSDSRWYPTLRLFRQAEPANWQNVFDQIEATLREEVCRG